MNLGSVKKKLNTRTLISAERILCKVFSVSIAVIKTPKIYKVIIFDSLNPRLKNIKLMIVAKVKIKKDIAKSLKVNFDLILSFEFDG